MANPVILDPAFFSAREAAVAAIVEEARTMSVEQMETCVLMLRNTRSAHNILEHENTEKTQAMSALAAVGLLDLAETAIERARTLVPADKSTNHLSGMAVGHWVERAILGTCLEGLPTINPHLVPRLTNPWRTLMRRPPTET